MQLCVCVCSKTDDMEEFMKFIKNKISVNNSEARRER